MAAIWVPQAMSHPSQTHGVRCSHRDLGTLSGYGQHSMGQRTGDTGGPAVCRVGWHHTRVLETLQPLPWHCPVLSESPHASPHAGLVAPIRTWHCPFIHQDLGTGSMGMGWAQHGHSVWHGHMQEGGKGMQVAKLAAVWECGDLWAWHGLGMV